MLSNPILCVDDDPFMLDFLQCILQDDYRLIFANNGTEALANAAIYSPALVLLDVEMRGMNGFDVARQLKAHSETACIPIIFVTAAASEQYEELGFEIGCVDYISKPFSACIVRARVKTHLSLIQASQLEASYHDAIHMLGAAGHYNDNDTGVHIWRMAEYCYLLALAVGWNEQDAMLLQMAAPMHDTGKIGIPDTILKKSGQLTEAEWGIMKQHSRIGYEILSKSDAPIFKLAAQIALNHHEKCDGTGYPNGRTQADIPEAARIVAVADVFDALSMKRPYKDVWSLDRILLTMNEMAGKHLDKRLVAAFILIMPKILHTKAKWETRNHDHFNTFEL